MPNKDFNDKYNKFEKGDSKKKKKNGKGKKKKGNPNKY